MTRFDMEAKSWDDVPGRQERAEVVAAAIRHEIRLHSDMTVLEYGCGTGLLSFALQSYLGSITLADNSSGMLEVLQKKITSAGVKNMTPMLLDLSSDPVPSGRFDLIYTLMTLHHIPDATDILQKFHTMLNPSGIVCIIDLDKEDGTFHQEFFDGHQGFDRNEFKEWLLYAGFENIRFSTPYRVIKTTGVYPLFLAVAERK